MLSAFKRSINNSEVTLDVFTILFLMARRFCLAIVHCLHICDVMLALAALH